jgi:SAM-dependent methyltransferase
MWLYALTILVSAFLLFQVQPVIAKIILPWFGGSAAVWTTCLVFFQVVLLLGYLYAHALTRYLRPRAQAILHTALLAASLVALPVYPGEAWKPSGAEDPGFRILLLLVVTVGLPYFLLSTTGPLIQAWYARRFQGAMPYRLYALSNAGSMFALLSYPVLFEPVWTTRQQSLGWSVAYAGFALLCAWTALRSRHGALAGPNETGATDAAASPPTARLYFFWLALPACASLLLLAVTNHLSQNVAAIPFLWVLPLSLYLLTFILCFKRRAWYWRNPFLQLLVVALGGMAYALSDDFENTTIKIVIPLFAAGLFVCCMVCHGELARLKPDPRYLTSYYVMISVGGALGGVIVGLVAPRVFSGYYELQAGLVVCAALAAAVLRADPDLRWFRSWKQPAPIAAVLVTLGMVGYLGWQVRLAVHDSRVKVRNFYGGLRVKDSGAASDPASSRTLTHGTINHGEQFLNPARRNEPTTYYGPHSGVGVAILAEQRRGALRVGVIGLGTGTLACYGRPGDYYRFYEINPLVIRLARTEFSFLAGSKGRVEVELGDARLSLEREAPSAFDVLAVDAFSSDSIPVHLLTREAFQLYFRHLKPDGVLAVHVSNRYLDLQPVVKMEAEALRKTVRMVEIEDDEEEPELFGSTWMLVAGDERFWNRPEVSEAVQPADSKKNPRLWTDDYSNLFQILK